MYPGTHAQSFPDKPAVIMAGSGHTVTYGELDERSNRLAQLWWDQGLRPGDHVAILMENNPRYPEVYWAAIRSGLYITTVNRHLTPPVRPPSSSSDSGAAGDWWPRAALARCLRRGSLDHGIPSSAGCG